MKMKIRKRGFTLVELLVVIAIIGILSSVVITSLNGARQKARDARRVSDIEQIKLALELYHDSCGRYPSTLTAGANNGCNGNTLGDYLSTIPTDPGVGNAPYSYAVFGTGATEAACTGTSYHLGGTLESYNVVLDSDKDASAATSGLCTFTGNTDFNGADTPTFVYDIKP